MGPVSVGLKDDRQNRAYTILEVLVTVALVGLLITLVVPISDKFKKRAEKAACMTQMRVLHSALSGHITDIGTWPQIPNDANEWRETEFYRFWITSLEPYGASRDTWLCPSDKLLLQMKKEVVSDKNRYFGTYVPTPFDEMPSSPYRWMQPWLVERGDFHGEGGHILMPDGSVSSSRKPFHAR